jgi:hypothetical protein
MVVAAIGLLVAGSATAQGYKAPRNAFGQPDFSGVWTNASVTQLERPPQFKSLVITADQAKTLEQGYVRMRAADSGPTDPKAPPPASGQDPGGYNTFWIDPGTKVGSVKGELRASWIVEPADGRLPYSAEGRRLFMAEVTKIQGNFDGPEVRQVAERCLMGFGSTAGPPMLNVLYNNTYQIQQSRDAVVIIVEMNHDARIVRLTDRNHPAAGHPAPGWATASVGGRAIPWWSRPPTSIPASRCGPASPRRSTCPRTPR